jgi:hypothetical protein
MYDSTRKSKTVQKKISGLVPKKLSLRDRVSLAISSLADAREVIKGVAEVVYGITSLTD